MLFRSTRLWNAIDGLDNKVPAAIQFRLYSSLRDMLRRETLWFLREAPRGPNGQIIVGPTRIADVRAGERRCN